MTTVWKLPALWPDFQMHIHFRVLIMITLVFWRNKNTRASRSAAPGRVRQRPVQWLAARRSQLTYTRVLWQYATCYRLLNFVIYFVCENLLTVTGVVQCLYEVTFFVWKLELFFPTFYYWFFNVHVDGSVNFWIAIWIW